MLTTLAAGVFAGGRIYLSELHKLVVLLAAHLGNKGAFVANSF